MLSILRRYKIFYSIYNFFKKEELEYLIPLYKKYGINKKYYSPISSKDFKGLTDKKNWLDVADSRIALAINNDFRMMSESDQKALIDWSEDGYAVLRNELSSDEVDRINSIIQEQIDSGTANWRFGNRIMFAIHQSDYLKSIGANPRIIGMLELLLGRKVDLFQSINFIKPSEQRAHSDSIHMSTFPQGNIIAIWIALEDIDENNGPLFYYPGSHKLPYIMNEQYGNEGKGGKVGNKTYGDYEDKIQEVIDVNELEKKIFTAKKGDVLIWHANLLHGGEPLIDKARTRKSLVFHYYSRDVICYHEITQRPTLKKRILLD